MLRIRLKIILLYTQTVLPPLLISFLSFRDCSKTTAAIQTDHPTAVAIVRTKRTMPLALMSRNKTDANDTKTPFFLV